MNIGLKLESNLSAALNAMPNATSFAVQTKALLAGAEPIRDSAEALAPVLTGGLSANIIVDPITAIEAERGIDFKDGQAAVLIGPTTSRFYGYFEEFGTVFSSARAWFRPAFESNHQQSLRIVGAHLWDSIRKMAAAEHKKKGISAGTSRGRSSGVGL